MRLTIRIALVTIVCAALGLLILAPLTDTDAGGPAGPSGITPSSEPPTPTPTLTPTPTPVALSLSVSLQRPNSPPPSSPWAVPVTLVLYPPGDASMALYSWTVPLDQNGQWSGAYPVAAGAYDVRVRNLHTLRNVRRNMAINGPTTLALGTLHEGDANGDNTVNILDFARLRGSYFLSRGAPGFDPATDFDENGTVNILDFALLRGSYFLQGDIEVTVRAATADVTAAAPVTLTLSPPSSVLGVGVVTPFTIEVDAGSRPLAGLDIELTYRPGIVAITDAAGQPASAIVPGPHFAVVLLNTVDPSSGKLTFSAANFDRTVSGLIQVASFHLRGVNEGAAEASFGPRSQGADDGGRQVPFALSQPSIQVTGYHRYLPIIFRQ